MDKRILIGLGSLVLCCGVSGVASADYVNMHLVEVAVDGGGFVPNTTTWRMYAEFDNANDQLNSVGGSPDSPGEILRSTSFYQNVFGGPFGFDINEALMVFFPSLNYDSWVTIGAHSATENDLLTSGFDTTEFEDGGNFYIPDGSWYIDQDDPNGFGVELVGMDNYHVLVGQFTIFGSGSETVPWGQLNLSGYNANGNAWSTLGATFGTPLPAPATIALLAFGCFVRRRRTAM
jgi:hypothetical protein